MTRSERSLLHRTRTRFAGWRRSARGRLVLWLPAIVAAGLLANLLAVDWFLLDRDRQQVAEELRHERDKFALYVERHAPARPGTERLLTDYIGQAVPDRSETLFSVVDGRAGVRSRNEVAFRLDLDPALVARVAAADEPYTDELRTPQGRARYAALPVRDEAGTRGALVVVEYPGTDEQRTTGVIQVVALVSLGCLLAVVLASWLLAGRILTPVRRLRDTASRIGEHRLSERIPVAGLPPDDEVTELAVTFNHMLDRLEGAMAVQREFLDDAAHELRTPLTVIHGHLELLAEDEGTPVDPAERDETITLVLDETARMARIVTDLLLLARAERLGELRLEPVELPELAMTVLAKAAALGERVWRVGRTTDAVIVADTQLLQQALLQLISNAVAQTRPGDVIAIGAEVVEDTVRLRVEDSGPGVPPDDREQIFARFSHRGEGGSGLGLAIVASIARAHGGTVQVDDSRLGGARFEIAFPVVEPLEELADDPEEETES